MIHFLFHSNYKIRHEAQNVFKKISNWQALSNRPNLVFTLLTSITTTFQNLSLFDTFETQYNSQTNGTIDATPEWPSPKGVYEFIINCGCLKNLAETELKNLAINTLILANCPLVKDFDQGIYERFLRKLLVSNRNCKLSTSTIINQQTKEFVSATTGQNTLNKSQLASVSTLAKLNGSDYLKTVIEDSIKSLLASPQLKNVTKEHVEIMNLPEGEMHDKSLIEAAIKLIQEASLGSANQKKESKTYSYKEQLADAELRKELDRKKRKEMENKKYSLDEVRSKMSKKQQEMLDMQIEKERVIREDMVAKNRVIEKSASVLISAIEGNYFRLY